MKLTIEFNVRFQTVAKLYMSMKRVLSTFFVVVHFDPQKFYSTKIQNVGPQRSFNKSKNVNGTIM